MNADIWDVFGSVWEYLGDCCGERRGVSDGKRREGECTECSSKEQLTYEHHAGYSFLSFKCSRCLVSCSMGYIHIKLSSRMCSTVVNHQNRYCKR